MKCPKEYRKNYKAIIVEGLKMAALGVAFGVFICLMFALA